MEYAVVSSLVLSMVVHQTRLYRAVGAAQSGLMENYREEIDSEKIIK